MKIMLQDAGKRFNQNWIFGNMTCVFENKKSYAITGSNGSGKSTLLQIFFNFQNLSTGKISYELDANLLSENPQSYISFAAPYLDLPDEFTLLEIFNFHFSIKKIYGDNTIEKIIAEAGLSGNENKQLKFFSSGMKQRVKLALAVFSDTPLLLLDEPCSNLDEQGITWYKNLTNSIYGKKTIIIASNSIEEYSICDNVICISDFRKN